jgi:hypothetical protein
MRPSRIGAVLVRARMQDRSGNGMGRSQNGRLLALAQRNFDVFLTVDQNLTFQQNLGGFNIAVLIVPAPSNDIADLLVFIPAILAQLPVVKSGQAIVVKPG